MNSIIFAAVVLPILAIIAIAVAVNILPSMVNAFVTTLQDLARAYPVLTVIALFVGIGMMLLAAFGKH